ncbi:MAG TPA: polyprenol monophosphomannose synthase [Rhodothermales bacterium]|nr:polyprenol monophosphomannose synthase [Rhodothermales bacterium]
MNLDHGSPAPHPPGRSAVVVPTYNEANNIASVLQRVAEQETGIDAIVVDDSSPDGTARLVRQFEGQFPGRIHLIERSAKQGLGTAYIAGFKYAIEQGYDFICEMDADLSHNPDDLPRLIAPVQNGTADLAVGSRYVHGIRVMNWPLSRLVISYGASIYTRMITRLPIFDVTAGFTCFHRRVLEAIDLDRIKSNGYSFQIEIKYRAWRRGFRLVEVPIVFTERTEGQSKMSKSIMREAARKVWELRLRAIVGKL